MYIFKNESGIELSVEEFLELIENDCLPELITIVAHLDTPEVLEGLIFENVDSEERLNRLFERFMEDE